MKKAAPTIASVSHLRESAFIRASLRRRSSVGTPAHSATFRAPTLRPLWDGRVGWNTACMFGVAVSPSRTARCAGIADRRRPGRVPPGRGQQIVGERLAGEVVEAALERPVALAVALADRRGFKDSDFADLHPGGKLGKKLALVESLMHSGEAIPRVGPHTKMHDVIYEMSRKGLGITTVVERERLVGIISDGDLRRLLEKRGKDVMDLTAKDCMTRSPQTISPTQFASAALNIMEQRKITSLVVVDSNGKVEGIVHLHDLWGTEML